MHLLLLLAACGWNDDDMAGLPMTHGTSLALVQAVGVAYDGQGWAIVQGQSGTLWATFHMDDFEGGFTYQTALPAGPYVLAVAREDGRAWIMAGQDVYLADPDAGLTLAGSLSRPVHNNQVFAQVSPDGSQIWMAATLDPWERWSIEADGTLGESLGTLVPTGACEAHHDGEWLYFQDCSGAMYSLKRTDEQTLETVWDEAGFEPLGFGGDYVLIDPAFPPYDWDGHEATQEDIYVRGYPYFSGLPAAVLEDGSHVVGTGNGLVWVGHGEHDKNAIEDDWCAPSSAATVTWADGWITIDGVDLGNYELSGKHSLTVTQSIYELQNWYAYTASDTVMDIYEGVDPPGGHSNAFSQTIGVDGLYYRGTCEQVVARANAR